MEEEEEKKEAVALLLLLSRSSSSLAVTLSVFLFSHFFFFSPPLPPPSFLRAPLSGEKRERGSFGEREGRRERAAGRGEKESSVVPYIVCVCRKGEGEESGEGRREVEH